MLSPFFIEKKLSILFGSFKQKPYLCTRFRKGSKFLKKLVW